MSGILYDSGNTTIKGMSQLINTYSNYSAIYDVANVSRIDNTAAACTEVVVTIVFDKYASDISWKVERENGEVVVSGSSYQNFAPDVSENVCLDDGTYTFTINDSYGDGLCCSYGQGSYAVSLNGTALVSGSSFKSSESKTFTIGKVSPPPTPINLIGSDITSNSVLLSWEVQGEFTNLTTFDVYNNNQIIKSVKGSKTVTLDELTPETEYNLSVRAKNIQGDLSEFSNKISITTLKGTDGGFSKEMLDLLKLVNEARATDGKQPLKMNAKLVAAAEFHANDMKNNNFFSHVGSNGSSVGDRVKGQGYSWNRVAENIANGQRTVQEVHNTWMNSSGHRGNILSADYTEIGMARVANLWVQVFARSFSSALLYDKDLAVSEVSEKLEIYPNLLLRDQNQLNVVGHNATTVYKIYSMTGKVMDQGKITGNTIKTNNLSSGMYLVNFIMNGKAITKRLVKK
jgi:uncharacterized protein YkwD